MAQKVVSSNPDKDQLTSEKLSVYAANGCLFESGKDMAAKGEGWSPPFNALPRIQWASNRHCPIIEYACLLP